MRIEIDIPESVAQALSEQARSEGVTLGELARLTIVRRAADGRFMPRAERDLSYMGGMSAEDASAVEAAHGFFDECGTSADADRA